LFQSWLLTSDNPGLSRETVKALFNRRDARKDLSGTGRSAIGDTEYQGWRLVPRPRATASFATPEIITKLRKDQTMSYDRITADNAAVLFVDHQTGLANGVQTQSPPEFINNVKALVTIAQIYKLPSIITSLRKACPTRRSCIGRVRSTPSTMPTSSTR
jgi:hypothetical protein